MLPTIGPFLTDLKGLRPKNKVAATFGSYGWGGGSIRDMEAILKDAGISIVMPGLSVNWAPTKEETQKCFEFGSEFAKKLLASLV